MMSRQQTLRSSDDAGARPLAPAAWLTPAVIPALLVLLGATALIYALAAR